MKKFLISILVLALVGLGGFLAYSLNDPDVSQAIAQKKTQDTANKNSSMQVVEKTQHVSAEDGAGGMNERLSIAYKKNRDATAWLRIPNTAIDNVVMQSTNNETYWRWNERKEYDTFGCYYADFRGSLGARDEFKRNTVIYGHSDVSGEKDKPDGKKFSQLFKFTDIEFAKNNPKIYLSTSQEETQWEIFAVFYSDTNFDYINVDASEEELTSIVAEAKKRSIYNYPITPTAQDKILTLSTCTVKFGKRNDQRFVVMARLLKPEQSDIITVNLNANPNPKQPEFK